MVVVVIGECNIQMVDTVSDAVRLVERWCVENNVEPKSESVRSAASRLKKDGDTAVLELSDGTRVCFKRVLLRVYSVMSAHADDIGESDVLATFVSKQAAIAYLGSLKADRKAEFSGEDYFYCCNGDSVYQVRMNFMEA